jgi:Spy/CpxP family protein refolding chaperone
MKASFLAVAVLWVGAAIAQAPDAPNSGGPGPGGPRRETPQQRLDHLTTLLDLTDSQKAQVQTVLEEERAKMRTLHEQAQASGQKPDFEQMKAERAQLQQETLTKLTPVLSPAQLKKFQLLMEHRQAEGPPGGPPPGGQH